MSKEYAQSTPIKLTTSILVWELYKNDLELDKCSYDMSNFEELMKFRVYLLNRLRQVMGIQPV